jgi:hypothetical protein
MSALEGIHYVRPPELKFEEIKNTDEYIEYKITTFKDSKEKNSENVFVTDIDSMLFCDDSFKIKMPKKDFMIKDGKKDLLMLLVCFQILKQGNLLI